MTPYLVGKYYRVPCVFGIYFGRTAWWPVLGPLHDDRGAINFPPLHYHVDVRFLSYRLFRFAARHTGYGIKGDQGFARHSPLMLDCAGREFASRNDAPRPVLKRLRCNRQWEHMPELDTKAKWIGALEREFSAQKLKHMVCPHRGADLSTLPVDRHGCVECPLHGLRWHVETGHLVPRAEWTKAEAARA